MLGVGNLHPWIRAGWGCTAGLGTRKATILSMCRATTALDGPCGSFQLRIFHGSVIVCRQSWTESSQCQTHQTPLRAGSAEHRQGTGGTRAASSASMAQPLPVTALSLTPVPAPLGVHPGPAPGFVPRTLCMAMATPEVTGDGAELRACFSRLCLRSRELAWAASGPTEDSLCTGNLSHVPYQSSCWYFTHTSCRKKPLLGAAEIATPSEG